MYKRIFNFFPILILLIIFAAFYYFKLYRYISLSSLKENRHVLLDLLVKYQWRITVGFIVTYILFVAASLPNAVLLTLLSGVLFGPVLGVVYVVISGGIGACILFLAAKTALHHFLYKKSSHWVNKFKKGFQKNQVSYLLCLRLIPIFPFWLINIIPAFFNVPFSTFTWTTFVGIIPGTAVYVFLGSSLNVILDKSDHLNLNIIFHPLILLALIGLGVLSLAPIFYKKFFHHEDY
jgi:uncharacterized membrane protein YdjX (TVP38/TMEM64 family)